MEHQQEQSSGDSHAVVVDIQSLAQALEQELAGRRRLLHGGSQAPTLTIGMVPKLTRNVDEHEYNPHYVSIGPYHRHRDNIGREEDKLACLNTILSAVSPRTTVQAYLTELDGMEGDARSFYADIFDKITRWEFLRMLLLDGCYLLNRFVSVVPENGSHVANGHVQGGYHASSSTAPAAAQQLSATAQLEAVSVLRDVLYLAENQIPYFVIDKIHKLTFPGSSGVPAVNAIAGYISSILQRHQYSMATVTDATRPPAPGNLLHLLHMHFPKPRSVPTTTTNSSATGKRVDRCRTATEYYINGVSFRSRRITAGAEEDEAHCILDVTFDRGTGTLSLPRLNIDAETWRILRNLIALEQQNPDVAGSHVTAYCVFMSQLACTAADVELLSRRGVISHILGNNEQVAELFSDLCKGVVFDADDAGRNYLRGTTQELDRCYGSRLRRWMALLSQKYFASPWLAIGVMAAAIVLVCTMVQALYAVLSYYSPGAAK